MLAALDSVGGGCSASPGLQMVWPQDVSADGCFGCQKCWVQSVLASLCGSEVSFSPEAMTQLHASVKHRVGEGTGLLL